MTDITSMNINNDRGLNFLATKCQQCAITFLFMNAPLARWRYVHQVFDMNINIFLCLN